MALEFLNKLFGKKESEPTVPAGTGFKNEFDSLLQQLKQEAAEQKTYNWESNKFSTCPAYQKIKDAPDVFRKNLMFDVVERAGKIRGETLTGYNQSKYEETSFYEGLLQSLMRLKTDFTEDELIRLFTAFRQKSFGKSHIFNSWPFGFAVVQVEKYVKEKGLSEKMKEFVQEVIQWEELSSGSSYFGSDLEKAKLKLQKLVHGADGNKKVFKMQLKEDDAFGAMVNQYMETIADDIRGGFYEMLQLAATATGAKPPKKYTDAAKELIDKVSAAKYKPVVQEWLEFVAGMDAKEHVSVHEYEGRRYEHRHQVFLEYKNSVILKGLVWSLVNFYDSRTLLLLAKLTERSYKKMPGVGPSAAGVGNACIYVLATSKGLEGISHLSRLKLRISQNNTKKIIQKYLDEASTKLGITSAEIEELAVPDFGLVDGVLTESFDDFKLETRIRAMGEVEQQWYKADGTLQKSPPASIKNDSKLNARLKKSKENAKQIQSYLTAQRDRIDRSYIDNRTWTYENFSKYYLNHGLVSFIAKRLIWVFTKDGESRSLLWKDGQWKNVQGEAVDWVDESCSISLWHPINCGTDEVLAWRNRLQDIELVQPMKQAYREVYILTDAEVNTRVYSNRMAAHILKQHQFNALAGIRGWKYSLLGAYDDGRDGETAKIQLPAYGITGEYWINEVNANDAFNDTGIWNYVATDQVRFVKEGEVLNLIDVPKLAFSEVMRDVDLFVGVCSVGNDPQWQDSGGLAQYRNYWESYSFGDLTEVAKTRKAVLERLLPRLKIKNVAAIDGKFLKVKGSKRTYKIHIGSTNILMEPNDQYLCIVPSREKDKTTENVFLPFEGDRGLSLVLSKAFLLAEDHKITDQTILSQIDR